jgi:hypothetical protein
MRQDYKKLFCHIEIPEPPADLLGDVINGIARERRHLEKRWRIMLLVITASGTIAAMAPILIMLKTAVAESGFWQYFSLIFSDLDIVMASWESYLASLLEALPVTGLILFFSILYVGLSLLKFVGTRKIRMA